jgi:hypothetical protein
VGQGEGQEEGQEQEQDRKLVVRKLEWDTVAGSVARAVLRVVSPHVRVVLQHTAHQNFCHLLADPVAEEDSMEGVVLVPVVMVVVAAEQYLLHPQELHI